MNGRVKTWVARGDHRKGGIRKNLRGQNALMVAPALGHKGGEFRIDLIRNQKNVCARFQDQPRLLRRLLTAADNCDLATGGAEKRGKLFT